MIRRISDSVDHAHRGIQEVVPIQVIPPSKRSGQDKKEHGNVRNGAFLVILPALDLSAAPESHQLEIRVLASDANDCQERQKHETALQEQIERKSKDVKPHINSKDRVRRPEGTTVAKAEIRVPLRIEADRKHRGHASHGECHGLHQRAGEKQGCPVFR